jgi:hypothetical protein
MRTSIFVALTAAFIQTAAAQDANKPITPDEGQVGEPTKQLTIKLIQKRLEAAGFADVQVSPEVHVVKAKDKDGKQTVLVVDPRTMLAIPLMPPESGTTGSGSEDEGDEKL